MARSRGNKALVRLSISLDPAHHTKLLRLADREDASLAWVVRRAVADYIERQEEGRQTELPMLHSSAGGRMDST